MGVVSDSPNSQIALGDVHVHVDTVVVCKEHVIRINNFRVDLTDASTETKSLADSMTPGIRVGLLVSW